MEVLLVFLYVINFIEKHQGDAATQVQKQVWKKNKEKVK